MGIDYILITKSIDWDPDGKPIPATTMKEILAELNERGFTAHQAWIKMDEPTVITQEDIDKWGGPIDYINHYMEEEKRLRNFIDEDEDLKVAIEKWKPIKWEDLSEEQKDELLWHFVESVMPGTPEWEYYEAPEIPERISRIVQPEIWEE